MNEQNPGGLPQREKRYDVVVVGGGAVGLSGALTLGRARRSVLVVDTGQPCGAPVGHVHVHPAGEGAVPSEPLEEARSEAAAYGVEVVEGEAVKAERLPGGEFRVEFADGSDALARRLLVTTGLVDELPPVPGLRERWGREVLHCSYCQGREVRDQAVGVLATGPEAVQQALLWRQWASRVTLFQHTAPEFGEDECERLAASGIRLVEGEVTGLEIWNDRLVGVHLEDGRFVALRAVAVSPALAVCADVLAGLDLAPVREGSASAPGVWVAGGATAPAEGVRAGEAVNADLVDEEVRIAVAERAEPFSARMESEVCELVLAHRRHGF